jgi:protein-L-isoaspartate(D-aspartate) O-methyltransferase
MANADEARERMVASQLAARGVRNPRVLEAMRRVPRHLFVPTASSDLAYSDCALPIGEAQTISQPYMVAAMTEAMALEGGERVLEVGTGSGYQAAVVAELAREVFTIERNETLAAVAAARLAALGCPSVHVILGDGTRGYPAAAPYDAIVVTAGAPHVPEALKAQLADGGRLVIPIGSRDHQELTILTRRGDSFSEVARETCLFVPLVGDDAWPR